MRSVIASLLVLPGSAAAQSMLDRPPNVSADWVAGSGTVQFNFLHRFSRSAAPERKVSNFPTFVIGVGLPQRTMIGFAYATNSTLTPRYPNEWEFFVRHLLVSELEGGPIDLGGQVGYNLASEGVDGEVSLAKQVGPVRLIGVTRVIANPFTAGKTQLVAGGGAVLRLSRLFAIGGDYATITNKAAGQSEKDAWSAGLHLAIPNTPHTLSLQATNTNTGTLQGVSRGESRTRYGFEFTIPLTLARYLRSRATPEPAPSPPAPTADPVVAPQAAAPDSAPRPSPAEPAPQPTPSLVADSAVISKPADPAKPPVATPSTAAAPKTAAPKTVRVVMKGIAYLPKRIEISAGTTLVWRNDDPLAHTVTAADKSFDSGLIQGGATWRRIFTKPGTYQVNCIPHPFMKSTIVVKAEP